MRKIPAVLLTIALSAFAVLPQNNFSAKVVEKSFGKIKEGLYVNKTEVSNLDYKKFLLALLEENKQAMYNASLPDSTTWWKDDFIYTVPLVYYYFRHPAYNNYPVVGISYENAVQYCQWLTDKYNATEKRKFSKVLFRLPTKEEWELAANGGDVSKQYTWGTGFIHNNRKMELCNFHNVDRKYDSLTKKWTTTTDVAERSRITKITSPVKSFFPSSFGMYNMCGNVAEMITEKGIAKGGSYTDAAWQVTIASEKSYDAATADIGFRLAMDVLEK